jgi:diaminopimelate epimerase
MYQLPFAKGHGTQNDFVVLPDLDGELQLTPGQVAALCDRRAGLGADGTLRVVRVAALSSSELAVADAAQVVGSAAEFFMDYRNADGTVAEMCGNGIRVFVRYLLDQNLVAAADLSGGAVLLVATRAGDKRLRLVSDDHGGDDLIGVDLGPWHVLGSTAAVAAGYDAEVEVAGLATGPLLGLQVDVGNPHVVCALPDRALLAAVDLTQGPAVSPRPANGTNVELVVPVHETGDRGHLLMRVHERGSGETRSCGTGAAAAALAARAWAGPGGPDSWIVDVPGGRLRVEVPAGDPAAGGRVELIGPAVIVASGEIDLDAVTGQSASLTVSTR